MLEFISIEVERGERCPLLLCRAAPTSAPTQGAELRPNPNANANPNPNPSDLDLELPLTLTRTLSLSLPSDRRHGSAGRRRATPAGARAAP